MPLPALHTVSLAPARHLLACQRVVEFDLWHESDCCSDTRSPHAG